MEKLIVYIVTIMVLIVIGKLLLIPLKIIFDLVLNAIFGGILLVLANIIGSSFGLSIPITTISAIVAGIFGVPGVILLGIMSLK